MDKRVAVTGIGVLSPCGIGRDVFFDAVTKGASGVKPVSLFDASGFKVKQAGEIKDFLAQDYLGQKGLRTLDRSIKLVCSAAKLALDDAGFTITEENTHDTGVCVGTTLGSVASISDFDKEALLDGVRYVNPALFPNTVINSPASQVSIKFNIKGFNTTISTGFSAGLDALGYAADFVRLGRAKVILAGGVEELCIQTFLGFYKKGLLSGLKDGAPEISSPFDKRRNGVILGEGTAILVLEEMEQARSRKANIYAEVLGYSSGFGAGTLKKTMRSAVKQSGINSSDIDYICAGANSAEENDLYEAESIAEVFGSNAGKVRVSSVKSMLGESYSASGALQAAAAVGAINKQVILPNINYSDKDERINLNIASVPEKAKIGKVLINSFWPNQVNSSLVVSGV